jgi:uncharacterized protein YhfF
MTTTGDKLIILIVLFSIAVAFLYSNSSYSNKEFEKCKQVGSVNVVYDIKGKPVCLHPGAVIEID